MDKAFIFDALMLGCSHVLSIPIPEKKSYKISLTYGLNIFFKQNTDPTIIQFLSLFALESLFFVSLSSLSHHLHLSGFHYIPLRYVSVFCVWVEISRKIRKDGPHNKQQILASCGAGRKSNSNSA